ncbi:tetratricopeptide repeat protein [Rickettsiales endosymbiont of Trichoplax sp. H2]|uniref:tetratricopeptide repeat protein n=1 Tax=Rickettsiales endosymbiont of Trichoplax sp. H2 TaxID=2021221 RepID=UPI0012B1C45F|nr:hypothetical protein [Rickettsiales endosymbiont of Trichoplax sp. H2]MSO13222.1 hypothetical protein [Rickettsiales endosymbiont of Trichoplax sp. H2]
MKLKTFRIILLTLIILFSLEFNVALADDSIGPYNLLQHLKNIPKKKVKAKKVKKITSNIKKIELDNSKSKIKTHKFIPKRLDVVVNQNIENTKIIFPWDETVNIASYIKNDYLYVIFDKYVPVNVKILNEYVNKHVIDHALVDDFYHYKIGDDSLAIVFKLVEKKINHQYFLVYKDMNSFIIKIFPQKVKSKIINFVSKPFEEPTSKIEFDIENLKTGKIISFIDPLNKGKITVLTTNSYQYGIKNEFTFVDLDVLPSIQGVAISEKSSELLFNKNDNLFWITSKNGLNISSKYGSSLINSIFQTPGFTKLKKFKSEDCILCIKPYRKGLEEYINDQKLIQSEIYNSSVDEKYNFRINLALLNLANGYYPESTSQLKFSIYNNPLLANKYDFLLAYAVSNVMSNRFDKAYELISKIDISSVPTKNLKEVRFWNDIINLLNNKPQKISGSLIEIFSDNNSAFLKNYPENIFIKIKLFELRLLIKNKYFNAAKDIIKNLSKINLTRENLAEFYYEQANLQKLAENNNDVIKLLTNCKNIDGSFYFSPKCEYELIDLEIKNKKISIKEGIEQLLYLDFKIRNSEFEITVLKRTAELYYMVEDYINALLTWQTIIEYFHNSFEALEAKEKMTTTFISIFLSEVGDKYDAFQKVAIFDEFSYLNLIGNIGDKIALKLVNYLIDLDLLDRASKILDHQYKYRLNGYEKEQVLNKLLNVYLELRKPKKVVELINESLLKNYPDQIKIVRTHIYAQALFEVNDDDKAIKVLDGDLSSSADVIRSNIYWKQKKWHLFNDNSEPYIYSLMKNNKLLTIEDANKILRQSVSYAYLDRKKLLSNLYNQFKNRLRVKHDKILNIIHLLVKLQNTKNSKKIVDSQDIQNIINDVYNQITH